MRVEVVRDITVLAGPGLEGLELALRLAHIGVEVVEIAELLSPESSIGVGRVVALVVLNVDKDVVLLSLREELLVVLKQLHCWLCDEDVDTALDSVKSNWVVSGVWGENGDFGRSADFLPSAEHLTYWRCPWGERQLQFCTHQDRSCPL